MAEYLPIHTPGQAVTYTAGAAITGGQLVYISGVNTVSPTTAASAAVVGVAGHDAASGAKVLVYTGEVQEVTAAAAVTAGQTLEAAAAGQVTPHTNGTNDCNIVGVAVTTAALSAKVRFQKR